MNRRRALIATLGSGADLGARQAMQFLVLLVLARLVTPADFGTVALLAVFVTIGIVAADAGMSTAILQAREVTQVDVDTAFWTSTALGSMLSTAGALLAFPISTAFGRPELAGLGAFLSLAILATSIGQVPVTLLIRNRGFVRLMAAGVAAAAVSGAAAIALAANGHGLQALAAQFVGFPACGSLLLLAMPAYRPRLQWSRACARRLFTAGRWVLAANLVDSVYLRLQVVVIGSLFGAASLGQYQRADTTQQLGADSTSTVVGRVALPMFAQSAHDTTLLRAGMRTGIRSVTAANAPVMALLGGLSGQFLIALFGPQWAPAAPLLSILCLSGLLWPLQSMSINLLYSVGWNREVLRIDLHKKAVAVACIAVGSFFGVTGVAWAQVAFSTVALAINGFAVGRAIDLPLRTQLGEAIPPAAVAAPVGLGVAVLGHIWSAPPWAEVVTLGVGGLAVYSALALALRLRAFEDVVPLLRRSGSRTS